MMITGKPELGDIGYVDLSKPRGYLVTETRRWADLKPGDLVMAGFGAIIMTKKWVRDSDGWEFIGYTDSHDKFIDIGRHPGNTWEVVIGKSDGKGGIIPN